MSGLRVLVVGASIAGPSAAYWLAKAGANVTVIERFPDLRTSGQAIDIRTVGVTVMRKVPGMEAAVRSKVVPIEGLAWVRDNGRPYGIIRATGNPDQQSLLSEYEIFRGDLARIIVDLTKDNKNVKYIYSEQVSSMQQNEQDEGPVTVNFANGTPSAEYDLVVAADGATSRTRAIGLQCGVREHIKPTNSWAAYFSTKQDLMNGSQLGQAYSNVGGRFMAIGPDPRGVNRVAFISHHVDNKNDPTLPFREASKEGSDALKQYVARRYKGLGWKTEEILREMMASDDFYGSEIVQVKLPSLYRRRFVLVGDAGYAPGPTGAGTSLAIAGAYLLAGEICKNKGSLEAGLKGYEEQMKPIIADLQKIPPFISTILTPQTVWGVWLRNNIFAFIAWTGILEFAQRLFGGALGSADKHKLPDYDWIA